MLLQLATGSIGEVRISGVPMAALGTAGALAGDLDLTLHEVEVGRPPTIGSMDASVTVGWDALAERLGSTLAGATLGEQDGKVAVTLTQQMMGQPLRVLMGLAVEEGSLVMTPETVAVGERQFQASLSPGSGFLVTLLGRTRWRRGPSTWTSRKGLRCPRSRLGRTGWK